jgi:two-component system CheB/CheR fusion protein
MPDTQTPSAKVTIVAIGASAGGLDPYERFFDSTSDDSGVAYVIIQHLSPNFQSMMDELLSRHSKMKIERVIDGLEVEPNTIYLNPPRTEMIVKDGTFYLTPFSENKLLNLPIDTFFQSLADEAGKEAIAVVLSGTGSDGTKGAEAIKEAGGLVLAQDLASAKFDGMPGSIIKLGYADTVGTPEMLAENVGRIIQGLPMIADPNLGVIKSPAQRIFQRLLDRFGTEFNYYKPATIDRRLERRAGLRNLTLEDYAAVVVNEPDEAEALYGDLLIEVTSFFRDPEAFESLRKKMISELASNMTQSKPVRIWVPGCASGEEAYSIAIMFADYARENGLDLHLKILATDIHHRSLDKASTGIYPASSLSGLSQAQLDRYFDVEENTYQIKSNLRRMVVFSPHNILKDPPFTRMDLIACRNVLIYFNDQAQLKVLALFHFALRKSGVLFLGPSETVGKLETEFSLLDTKWRIFQKKRDVRLMESVSLLPISGSERDRFETQSITQANTIGRNSPIVGPARQAHNDALKEMLLRYAPAGFLLNAEGEIVHVFGDAGEFLQVANGVFSKRIVDLVEDDLKMIISSGLERTRSSAKIRFERRLNTFNEEHGNHSIVIIIDTVSPGDAVDQFALLTLERVTEAAPVELANVQAMDTSEAASIMQNRIHNLERDLKATEESLQSTIEELETSNEELQATNEELMASNEELQSTNEELHSVNEELYTVSSEHQKKIEELMEATDDMDHLLRATDIGIIFLDETMKIRRFTPSAKSTFNIIAQDVGRPIDHITYRFEKFDLIEQTKTVRDKGVTFEQEVEVDGQTFMLRILPYRTSLSEIVGAVITTVDITEVKVSESARLETTRTYETIVHDLTDFLLRWTPKSGEITYANQRMSDELNIPLDKIIKSDIAQLGIGQNSSVFSRMKQLEADQSFENEVLRYDPMGNEVYISGTVRPIFDAKGDLEVLQATGRNVTNEFNYRQVLEALYKLQQEAVPGREIELVEELLEVSRDYLNMDRALVSKIVGDELHITNVVGGGPSPAGSVLPLAKSMGSQASLYESDIAFFENIAETEMASQAGVGLNDFQSFISVNIRTANEFEGRIAFHGLEPRAQKFSKEEKMFVRLLGQTIGSLIERSEFVKDIEYRRAHYVSVYEQAPILLCTLNPQGKILEVNSEWLKSLGLDKDASLGAQFRDFVSQQDFTSDWPNFPKLQSSDAGKRSIVTTLRAAKGDDITVELTATNLEQPGSKQTHSLISMVDVTEKQNAFERVAHQKAELEKANEGLSTFAYIASHDLQEPLRKIRQYVDFLEAECQDALDKDGQYYLSVITGSAARISYLVKDILAYTTASNADINIEDIDLLDIMEEVLEDASEKIENASAKVSIGKLPVAKGDWGAAKLLFQNLVSNGLKYQASGTKPKVSVKGRALKNSYVIDFYDNGIGIDDVEGKDIFDPFVRLQSKFEYAGTGIGLAICKAVCERMGWSISHKDNAKGGTIFTVTIPNDKV